MYIYLWILLEDSIFPADLYLEVKRLISIIPKQKLVIRYIKLKYSKTEPRKQTILHYLK